ncbi:SDR family oxidoreductase [Mucilaginibacter antarcticus]|uniref:SDR family oxidoreductase n=1 Tax=Mucilaginibacter antarcticus TaxID=1855725 RepID=A0ABW5XQ43_9SPHI
MLVFVTGASGFVGSAVVKELIEAGHEVLGLARSEASAKTLREAGAALHIGSLDDLESLKAGAAAADGVIHTAFIHDFSNYKENCEVDRRAIQAMGEALAGTDKPLVITSGTALVISNPISNERDQPNVSADIVPRVASEEAAAAMAAKGVNVRVVRLPPSTHGTGDYGFVPMLANIAKEKGEAVYVGDGLNLWPAAHRFDAARLYRLVLERGTAATTYHAVAEQGVTMRDIATLIGKKLGLPVVSKNEEEAAAYFGWMTHFAGMNVPSSSQITRDALSWEPSGLGLLEDIEQNYFNS